MSRRIFNSWESAINRFWFWCGQGNINVSLVNVLTFLLLLENFWQYMVHYRKKVRDPLIHICNSSLFIFWILNHSALFWLESKTLFFPNKELILSEWNLISQTIVLDCWFGWQTVVHMEPEWEKKYISFAWMYFREGVVYAVYGFNFLMLKSFNFHWSIIGIYNNYERAFIV